MGYYDKVCRYKTKIYPVKVDGHDWTSIQYKEYEILRFNKYYLVFANDHSYSGPIKDRLNQASSEFKLGYFVMRVNLLWFGNCLNHDGQYGWPLREEMAKNPYVLDMGACRGDYDAEDWKYVIIDRKTTKVTHEILPPEKLESVDGEYEDIVLTRSDMRKIYIKAPKRFPKWLSLPIKQGENLTGVRPPDNVINIPFNRYIASLIVDAWCILIKYPKYRVWWFYNREALGGRLTTIPIFGSYYFRVITLNLNHWNCNSPKDTAYWSILIHEMAHIRVFNHSNEDFAPEMLRVEKFVKYMLGEVVKNVKSKDRQA